MPSYSTCIVAFILIGLLSKYVSYRISVSTLHQTFDSLSNQYGGTFSKGSFFRPPTVMFSVSSSEKDESVKVKIRSFFLYRGQRGNYTEISFALPQRNYTASFSITVDDPEPHKSTELTLSVTEPVPTDDNTYDLMEELLMEIAKTFSADLINCSFDGQIFSVNIRSFLETREDIDKFYGLCHQSFTEGLKLISQPA